MEENKKDKKIIVDCAYWYDAYPHNIIAELDGKMYIIPTRNRKSNNLSDFRLVKKVIGKECMREFPDYDYITFGLEKKSGYNVVLRRAITKKELEELKKEFSLTDDDISEPYESVLGDVYGKYAKKYKCIQVKVPDYAAMGLATRLMNKGIEAANTNVGIVKIRVPGQTLKELREKTGMSQSVFASYFGLSVRTLQEWEQGNQAMPAYLLDLLDRVWTLEREN